MKVGDVVIIKSKEQNRNKWKLGIVVNLMSGCRRGIGVAKLRTGKGYRERAVQHIYPLELLCDMTKTAEKETQNLDKNAEVLKPKRDAAAAAKIRMQSIAKTED